MSPIEDVTYFLVKCKWFIEKIKHFPVELFGCRTLKSHFPFFVESMIRLGIWEHSACHSILKFVTTTQQLCLTPAIYSVSLLSQSHSIIFSSAECQSTTTCRSSLWTFKSGGNGIFLMCLCQ